MKAFNKRPTSKEIDNIKNKKVYSNPLWIKIQNYAENKQKINTHFSY